MRVFIDEALLRQALEAIEYMHTEKCDYMRRNNLGNPLRESAARLALPAITALRERLAQPCAGRNCGSTNPNLKVEVRK